MGRQVLEIYVFYGGVGRPVECIEIVEGVWLDVKFNDIGGLELPGHKLEC